MAFRAARMGRFLVPKSCGARKPGPCTAAIGADVPLLNYDVMVKEERRTAMTAAGPKQTCRKLAQSPLLGVARNGRLRQGEKLLTTCRNACMPLARHSEWLRRAAAA